MPMQSEIPSRNATETEPLSCAHTAQLRLLRFERENDPCWNMLYLDAACNCATAHDALNSELYAATGSTYARFMHTSSSTRLGLHEQIQQQLAEQGCYQVHYRLHIPHGHVDVLEAGELALHDGSKLHGQLVIHPHLEPSETRSDHQAVLPTEQPFSITGMSQHTTETIAELLQQTRANYHADQASLWLIQGDFLYPLAQWPAPATNPETPIPLAHCPDYQQALQTEPVIAAQNVQYDPRLRERFTELNQRHVLSVLEAGLWQGHRLFGVIRLEQTQVERIWHHNELAAFSQFAKQCSDLLCDRAHTTEATQSLALLQRAVAQTASACLLVDRNGRIEYANPSFTTITQFQASEVEGHQLADLPALAALYALLQPAMDTLTDNNNWQGEFQSQRKDLSPYWGHLSVSKIVDDAHRLTHYIVLYEDITETRLAQQHIERLAYTDSLTGLANRTCFIHHLEKRFHTGSAQNLVLLLVDIDNFKRINDSLGHRIGDKLLIKLAQRLQGSLGDQAVVARFASNEFALLISDMDFENGLVFAQQILCALDDPIYVDGQLINVTGSIGLACAPLHGQDPHNLMKHAGLALHKSKANGKNQVQVCSSDLNAEADFKLFLENNLRCALAQNELAVFYQPKVCLKTARLLGMEALLRWNHPERGMISPDQFIRVAEETGLIIPIGYWAARRACRMAYQLQKLGLGPLHMAINLSPRQFADPDLVENLSNILQEEQLPPNLLELELTESLLLDASEQTHRKLKAFKNLGISLAMDDFGTGYSSLSYLKKFPIDVIKIDRSFIKDIPDNQDDMEITSAVIAMAHKLRLNVVAEGIETPQQLGFLRRQHCDIAQGYLFDRPIPESQLLEQLQRYAKRTS